MRRRYLAILTVLFGMSAQAAITPVKLAEKASYRLAALVTRGTVPSYMSTDLAEVQFQAMTLPDGSQGTAVILLSPSNVNYEPNSVTVNFTATGSIIDSPTHVVGQGNSVPIFVKPDGAKLLDLAAEAVVDHLAEDSDLPLVARETQVITVTKDGGALFSFHLSDGRIYKVLLGLDGHTISRGF